MAALYLLEFRGSATTTHKDDDIAPEAAYWLNEGDERLAGKLEERLRAALPTFLMVQAQLTFSDDALVWTGEVQVADWEARLGSVQGLGQYLRSLTCGSVNRLVAREMRRNLGLPGYRYTTEARLLESFPLDSTLTRSPDVETQRSVEFLTKMNLLILLGVLLVTIYGNLWR